MIGRELFKRAVTPPINTIRSSFFLPRHPAGTGPQARCVPAVLGRNCAQHAQKCTKEFVFSRADSASQALPENLASSENNGASRASKAGQGLANSGLIRVHLWPFASPGVTALRRSRLSFRTTHRNFPWPAKSRSCAPNAQECTTSSFFRLVALEARSRHASDRPSRLCESDPTGGFGSVPQNPSQPSLAQPQKPKLCTKRTRMHKNAQSEFVFSQPAARKPTRPRRSAGQDYQRSGAP